MGTQTVITPARLLAAACSILLLPLFLLGWKWSSRPASLKGDQSSGLPRTKADTAVIYVFSGTDPEYQRNLQYFVQHGMAEDDGCDYWVVVQEGAAVSRSTLPALPSHAQYVFHENKCYDWGTFGWVLKNSLVEISQYKFFVFINSSVRGPYFPPYWQGREHWTSVLTSRLTSEVKLVGPTISCETYYIKGNRSAEPRENPHVQSYVVATDQVGLQILIQDGGVFKCWDDMLDTIFYAELGSSRAILQAGYTIDSLMLKYAGIDWRDKRSWGCNAGVNPCTEYGYDGLSLNPLEVMFVKVKSHGLDVRSATAIMAATYDHWSSAVGSREAVLSNDYKEHMWMYRLGQAFPMLQRGQKCFDFQHYKQGNRDIPDMPNDWLWHHWVVHGQFEARIHRFTCANKLLDDEVAESAMQALVPPV